MPLTTALMPHRPPGSWSPFYSGRRLVPLAQHQPAGKRRVNKTL
jgi:hypothetical protein